MISVVTTVLNIPLLVMIYVQYNIAIWILVHGQKLVTDPWVVCMLLHLLSYKNYMGREYAFILWLGADFLVSYSCNKVINLYVMAILAIKPVITGYPM